MDYLIYLIYPMVAIALLWGLRIAPKGEYWDDFLSIGQTKCLQGFCLVVIMVHHASLKLCEPHVVPEKYVKHGLEPFMFVGYLMVAVFFFCSGYGLYKSLKQKEEYLKGFFFKRLAPLLTVYALSTFLFLYVYLNVEVSPSLNTIFSLFGLNTINPYGWFVYAIIFCYVVFYNAFKRIKSDSKAILVVFVAVILYMLFCNNLLYGDYWYNTILIFPLGLLFAKEEEKILAYFQREYKRCLIIASVSFVVTFALGEFLSGLIRSTDFFMGYMVGQFLLAIVRSVAGAAFVMTMLLITKKVKLQNKLLSFIGGMTLEFYLLHGLFVQYFASECLSGMDRSGYYIKNPLLYVIVVFVLTLGSCFLAHLLLGLLYKWMKKSLYFKLYAKTLVHLGVVILIVILLITAKTKYEDIRDTNERAAAFESFDRSQNRIELSDGKKMAYFIEGEGPHTIVLLGPNLDTSNVLTMRYVSKFLADDNKVVVFDILGKGFSDDTDTPRSAENVANEVHEALEKLAVDDKYILMAFQNAGNYALKYQELYPQDVEAMIGVDMATPQLYDAIVDSMGMRKSVYQQATKKQAQKTLRGQKFLVATGYARWQFAIYEPYFQTVALEDYTQYAEEMFIKRAFQKTSMEEEMLFGDNCASIESEKFPEDMPVLMIMDYVSTRMKLGDTTTRAVYQSRISDPEKQIIKVLEGDSMFYFYKGGAIAQQVRNFVKNQM